MSLDFYLTYEVEKNTFVEVFEKNITHNLGKMANEAGLYNCLWRPDEHGFKKAKDIIQILKKGLEELKNNPDKYKQFNSENGWGTYEGLRGFVYAVLEACQKYPNALINVSR